MNGHGKSDSPIVPGKPPNKRDGAPAPAEGVEERGLAKGNPPRQTSSRTQRRKELHHALERIRQAAHRDKEQRFTALWHHVYDEERLLDAYMAAKHTAAAGVDGVTWSAYGVELADNLRDLSERLRRGSYRASPVKRAYIPKPDGRQRPIGVPVLEDKIVQRAAAEVMSQVWEPVFKGFSYGFRPGRGAHDALDALSVGILKRKVNWVLDADIRGFFDAIDHEWMMRFVEYRIADRRVLRHVRKWLKAGVLEKGKVSRPDEGTPQGGSISPLLANIYLHNVLDEWVDWWRGQHARGDVIIVRYADDFVVGFQHRQEAEAFLKALKARLEGFNLHLHEDKTRLIEFGRFARANRKRRGQKGKPETFNFLGFTHICGEKRDGWFTVIRRGMRDRMRRKLSQLKEQLRERMHAPVPDVGQWLARVLDGYYRYYAVPFNRRQLGTFRYLVSRMWFRVLRRRSQRNSMTWERMVRLIDLWLPKPRILHPYPEQRLRV